MTFGCCAGTQRQRTALASGPTAASVPLPVEAFYGPCTKLEPIGSDRKSRANCSALQDLQTHAPPSGDGTVRRRTPFRLAHAIVEDRRASVGV